MTSFTYEPKNRNPLETYDWDSTWICHTEREEARRVLYIGDSISCALRTVLTPLSGEEMLFDGFGTSKAVDNPLFCPMLRLFMQEEKRRDLILFNNGLHGFHLEDTEAYAAAYENTVREILSMAPSTPLILVLSTYTSTEPERVPLRNEAVRKIAKRLALPVLDLYTTSLEHQELLSEDGVHFTPEGYEVLARKILSDLG